MLIQKELKNKLFVYDDERRDFVIQERNSEGVFGHHVTLNKIEAFSFSRFKERIDQRNWLRRKK